MAPHVPPNQIEKQIQTLQPMGDAQRSHSSPLDLFCLQADHIYGVLGDRRFPALASASCWSWKAGLGEEEKARSISRA